MADNNVRVKESKEKDKKRRSKNSAKPTDLEGKRASLAVEDEDEFEMPKEEPAPMPQQETPYEDVPDFWEMEGGGEEEDACAKLYAVGEIEPPQVWLRIKPPLTPDAFFLVDDADPKRLVIPINPPSSSFVFEADGIFQPEADQAEVFDKGILDVVDKGMEGQSGAIVSVGPELSGKSYTLFGCLTKFKQRGMVFRALERIFDIREEKRDQVDYHIILSMFEIHVDRIKDLLTLGPYDLQRVGEFGPMGLFYEEIRSIEHGICLILRGLQGQALMHCGRDSKLHTILYIDILAKEKSKDDGNGNGNTDQLAEWRSRLTFTKVAATPPREKEPAQPAPASNPNNFNAVVPTPTPNPPSSFCTDLLPKDFRFRPFDTKDRGDSCKKGCRGLSGKLAESISIRKDMYYLEQMFVRAHELRKINEYYKKLVDIGMHMLVRPPKPAQSQYFRPNKFTHCLKDVATGTSNVRLIVHLRPEKSFAHLTLEVLRFATRTRCLTSTCKNAASTACRRCDPIDSQSPAAKAVLEQNKLNAAKLAQVMNQVASFFDKKVDGLEGTCRDQVKLLFGSFTENLNKIMLPMLMGEQEPRMPSCSFSGGNEVEAPTIVIEPDQTAEGQEGMEEEHDSETVEEHKKSRNSAQIRPPSQSLAPKKKTKNQHGSNSKLLDKHTGSFHKEGEGEDEDKQASESSTLDGEEGHRDSHLHPEEKEKKSTIAEGVAEGDPVERLWQEFVNTDAGQTTMNEYNEKYSALKTTLLEHEELQKELVSVFERKTHLEIELDQAEQGKRSGRAKSQSHAHQTEGEESRPSTISTVAEVPRMDEGQMKDDLQALVLQEEEIMMKLKEARNNLQERKSFLDESQKQAEQAFKEFAESSGNAEHFDPSVLPLTTLDKAYAQAAQRWTRVRRVKEKPVENDCLEDSTEDDWQGLTDKELRIAREFEGIRKRAKLQVETLMKAYPTKPPWNRNTFC